MTLIDMTGRVPGIRTTSGGPMMEEVRKGLFPSVCCLCGQDCHITLDSRMRAEDDGAETVCDVCSGFSSLGQEELIDTMAKRLTKVTNEDIVGMMTSLGNPPKGHPARTYLFDYFAGLLTKGVEFQHCEYDEDIAEALLRRFEKAPPDGVPPHLVEALRHTIELYIEFIKEGGNE